MELLQEYLTDDDGEESSSSSTTPNSVARTKSNNDEAGGRRGGESTGGTEPLTPGLPQAVGTSTGGGEKQAPAFPLFRLSSSEQTLRIRRPALVNNIESTSASSGRPSGQNRSTSPIPQNSDGGDLSSSDDDSDDNSDDDDEADDLNKRNDLNKCIQTIYKEFLREKNLTHKKVAKAAQNSEHRSILKYVVSFSGYEKFFM